MAGDVVVRSDDGIVPNEGYRRGMPAGLEGGLFQESLI